VELAKKYAPPAYKAYQEHGFKPVKIVSAVHAEVSSKGSVAQPESAATVQSQSDVPAQGKA
jgi:hypothetical protein